MIANLSALESLKSDCGLSAPVSEMAVLNSLSKVRRLATKVAQTIKQQLNGELDGGGARKIVPGLYRQLEDVLREAKDNGVSEFDVHNILIRVEKKAGRTDDGQDIYFGDYMMRKVWGP
jgi:hypothetical protein